MATPADIERANRVKAKNAERRKAFTDRVIGQKASYSIDLGSERATVCYKEQLAVLDSEWPALMDAASVGEYDGDVPRVIKLMDAVIAKHRSEHRAAVEAAAEK